ncbi:MAG: SusC/RagA family TonB-linked outer membrane protein [Phocaeicola plebeius]
MSKRVKSVSMMIALMGAASMGAVYAETLSHVDGIQTVQQSGTCTGVVKDAAGETVIGASVVVKGTTNGTITGLDGDFSLSGVKKGSIIQISFVGYETQEITWNGQPLTVTLKDDSQQLDEVVVTALGIKREKKALGYSVSSVKGDELLEAGTPMNAMQALYGKTSGLQLQSTASGPSGGMNIKVRNAISLTESSSTRPLIVVDGIPIHDENTGQSVNSRTGGDHGTGLNDINSEDIASIEILKGAKAAVLYGSEGANGVMLITTKSGSKKGLGIDFGINHSWNVVAYYPELQNEYGTGASPGTAALKEISKDGFYTMTDPNTGQTVESLWRGASGNFGPRMDGRQLLWWDGNYYAYTAQENNLKDLYRTGGQTNVNFAVSNSGDLGSFRLSYNYRDYNAVTQGADNAAHQFAFSADLKANDFIKIKWNTNYSNTRDHNAPYAMQSFSTYGFPREQDVNLIKNTYLTEDGYNYFSNQAITALAPYTSYLSSYYWSQLRNSNDFVRNHLLQSLNIDVKFNDKFSWMTLGGMDWTVSDQEIKQHVSKPLAQENKQGWYQVSNTRDMIMYGQSSLNYNQTFKEKWDVSAMVGGAVKWTKHEQQSQWVEETFAVENWFSLSNTREDFGPRSSRSRGDDLLLSIFASAQLAYANQVFLELQARNDWSSILPPENNHYFYPGASLSWIFTEAFNIQNMNFGKVRVSWADVGRPGPRYYGNVGFNLGSYGGQPTMSLPSYLPPADFAGSTGGFPQANLKPERKREYEVGLEASFLPGNRINVDFSFFHNNTYDQITTLSVPSSSGINEVRMNAGDIAQNGIEFSLNTKPIVTKDWTWDLGINLANYSTKVKKLGKGIDKLTMWGATGARIYSQTGGQYGEIFIYPYLRDEQGNRVVNQGTGVWELDKTQEIKVGKITPDIVGGLTTGLTYKDFSINAVFDFQFGATMISQTNMYLLGNGSGKKSLQFRDEAHGGLPYYVNTAGERILLDSHTAAVPADSFYPFILHDGVITPGVTPDGKPNEKLITAQMYYSNLYWQGGMDLCEDQIYKSDYIALRSLSFNYNLPKKFLSKFKIQNARLSAYANNLCYLYKDIPNVTPESTQGTNSFTEVTSIPGIRSFGIGLNLSF